MTFKKKYKILSIFFVGLFFFYLQREYNLFLIQRENMTNEILKEFLVRKKGFENVINDKEIKENIQDNNLENNGQESGSLEVKNQVELNKNITDNEVKERGKFEKRYIHAATFKTENSAKVEAKRLGEGYKVKEVKGNGKVMYQVVTDIIEDEEIFNKLEMRAKSLKMKYVVRMVGK